MRDVPPVFRLVGLGWYVAICIVFGIVGGLLLDNELGTRPLFIMVGLFLGLGLAGWGGYKQLTEALRDTTRKGQGGKQD
jgi:F0F1-type ATP synthase assembly protein I